LGKSSIYYYFYKQFLANGTILPYNKRIIIMIKIVIIDGYEHYRQHLNLLLSREADFKVVGAGKDGYDAIRLADSWKPDILLMDIDLPLINGTKVISLLKLRSPATRVIVYTAIDDDEYVKNAIVNGVSGYLLKDDQYSLIEGIRTVYTGDSFMAPHITTRAFRIMSALVKDQQRKPCQFGEKNRISLPHISRTEFRVTACIGRGFSNKEIAQNLHLREGTVRNYISSILQKIGLRDRTQLAIYALSSGITDIQPLTQNPQKFGRVRTEPVPAGHITVLMKGSGTPQRPVPGPDRRPPAAPFQFPGTEFLL
jgi:DNA-binding NarL/FixJ family response regulator